MTANPAAQSSIHTISQINRLSEFEKPSIYTRLIPVELIERFHLNPFYVDRNGYDLLEIECPVGSTSVEMRLKHRIDFVDPILYGHLTDTITGHIHVLLYILNNPDSPRFDVDRLPDGTSTKFGTLSRNIEAEISAMKYGLAPGQVRKGLRLLGNAIEAFEEFVRSLGHDLYFAEPLYYHNAVIFEKNGFSYEKGRSLMEYIQRGFSPGGELFKKLDNTSPFRIPQAAASVRLRSWALHDGILGVPFANVTMYKRVGKLGGIRTCIGCEW